MKLLCGETMSGVVVEQIGIGFGGCEIHGFGGGARGTRH